MFIVQVAFAGAEGPCSDAAEVAARSATIKGLYDAGEEERADRTAKASSVLKRDEERIKEVLRYDGEGALCTKEDKWFAAWILTQADTLPRIERAYELALETMTEHHQNGPWLVAFTFDLKRTRGGFRQSYGTQTRINERNQRCLIELEPEVTDEDRARYGTRPIVQAYRDILDRNGFQDDAATLENVERRGLYCKPLATRDRDKRRIAPPPGE